MEVQFKVDGVMYYDFLHYLFPSTDEILKVSSKHGLGKLIIAHCKIAVSQVATLTGDNVVTLSLPICEATDIFQNRWLYLDKSSIVQLNKALQSYFDLDFVGYYRATESAYSKTDIIDAYIVSRKLISTDNFENLTKRAYRRDLDKLRSLRKKLKRKSYYVDESIDKSGLG